ncbi:hypothetical protein [Streptomyces albipurpureus]|uniref:AAA+ ATPase domain-containing protein n=1 Tax=Streptomyces albipurpureus TaxID=2897419 RepID=A0ABT0UJL0_9ACTN|nr:hypothetical protein [Streptomyces sp. CWNU-1]MCM2388837.1 hypothetical protein [Streptomyces sp. CWNU-1]
MSAEAPGGGGGPARAPAQDQGSPDRGRDRGPDRENRDRENRDRDHRDRDRGRDRDHRDRDHRDGDRDRDRDDRDRDRGRDDRGEPKGPAGNDESDSDSARSERAEREQRQGERFRDAMADPLSDDGASGGTRASTRARREAQVRFEVRGNSGVFDRSRVDHAHFGDVYVAESRTARAPVFGLVPDEELARLRQVYRAPAGYQTLKDILRNRRVLLLGGSPGTGRSTTALCLLDELTVSNRPPGRGARGGEQNGAGNGGGNGERGTQAPDAGTPGGGSRAIGRVTRLDPSAAAHLVRDLPAVVMGVPHGGGLILQLPEEAGDWPVPQELHLDALSAALAERAAFAVLVASPSSPGGGLLTGRYGRQCPPAPARELLSWHLEWGLSRDAGVIDTGALEAGNQILDHSLFQQALGIRLDALRPGEAEYVARLLVKHLAGGLSRERLLSSCGEVARLQAREWFTGRAGARGPVPGDESGRAGEQSADGMDSLLREMAFRVALAVLDGEAFSAVADAADLLAWELLQARDPARAPGRPVFMENLEGLLAACRADLAVDEDDTFGGVPLPVRTVAYRGEALAGAVLAEVWERHHSARAPLVRWLRTLADDPRPQVWTRAAVVAGELCAADVGYGFLELIRPLAAADAPRRRFFAATALDQMGARDPHRAAVRVVVRDWADAAEPELRWTAAVVLGYGRTEQDTRYAVDLLGEIGSRDEGRLLQVASFSLARLASGSRAAEVLTELNQWAAELTGEYRDLALLSALRLAWARTDELWEPETAAAAPAEGDDRSSGSGSAGAERSATALRANRLPPVIRPNRRSPSARWRSETPHSPQASTEITDRELGLRAHWPLAIAVAVAVPEADTPLAELVWRALDSHLSSESALDAVREWLRVAEEDAVLPGPDRRIRTYAFEDLEAAGASGLDPVPGEILRALLWFLPRLMRQRRDWERLLWLLKTMVEAPDEPMTEAFAGHVRDVVGAGLPGPREERS